MELTNVQHEIIQLLAQDKTIEEIAIEIDLPSEIVKIRINIAKEVTKTDSIMQLVVKYIKEDIVSREKEELLKDIESKLKRLRRNCSFALWAINVDPPIV